MIDPSSPARRIPPPPSSVRRTYQSPYARPAYARPAPTLQSVNRAPPTAMTAAERMRRGMTPPPGQRAAATPMARPGADPDWLNKLRAYYRNVLLPGAQQVIQRVEDAGNAAGNWIYTHGQDTPEQKRRREAIMWWMAGAGEKINKAFGGPYPPP